MKIQYQTILSFFTLKNMPLKKKKSAKLQTLKIQLFQKFLSMKIASKIQ